VFEQYSDEKLEKEIFKTHFDDGDMLSESICRMVASKYKDLTDGELFDLIETEWAIWLIDSKKLSSKNSVRNRFQIDRRRTFLECRIELYRRNMKVLGVSLPIQFFNIPSEEYEMINEVVEKNWSIKISEKHLKEIEDPITLPKIEEEYGPTSPELIEEIRQNISKEKENVCCLVRKIIIGRIERSGYSNPQEAIKDKGFLDKLIAMMSSVIYDFKNHLTCYIESLE
jgi:hypothetical protein